MFLVRDGIDNAGEGGYGEMITSLTETVEGIQATLQLKRLFESKHTSNRVNFAQSASSASKLENTILTASR